MTGDALCLVTAQFILCEAHAFLIPLLRFIGLELGAKNVTGEPTFASPLASKEHPAHRHAGRFLKSAYPSTAMISFAIPTVCRCELAFASNFAECALLRRPRFGH
jgi:hypothetical protein